MRPATDPAGVTSPPDGTNNDTNDLRHHTDGELLAGLAGAADRRRAHALQANTGAADIVEESRRIADLEEALVVEFRSRPRRTTAGDITE